MTFNIIDKSNYYIWTNVLSFSPASSFPQNINFINARISRIDLHTHIIEFSSNAKICIWITGLEFFSCGNRSFQHRFINECLTFNSHNRKARTDRRVAIHLPLNITVNRKILIFNIDADCWTSRKRFKIFSKKEQIRICFNSTEIQLGGINLNSHLIYKITK